MPRFTLDGREVEAAAGTTILRAARERGLRIPTLCWDESVAPCTSCMVCVVRDARHGRLIPSCSYPVQDGLIIETGGEDGMQTFNQAVYKLIKSGLITEAYGMRYATNPEALRMNLRGIFLDEGKRILSS